MTQFSSFKSDIDSGLTAASCRFKYSPAGLQAREETIYISENEYGFSDNT